MGGMSRGDALEAVPSGVDGVDGMYDQLRNAGVDVDAPEDHPWGLRTFHVHDPNGYEWELVEETALAET